MNTSENIIKIIMELFDVVKEKCQMETDFINDLGADDLALIETVMEVEEQFNVNIEDDELDKIKTIGDLVKLVEEKIK